MIIVYKDCFLSPENLHKLLGKNIRRFRKRDGMTQDQLAEKAGINQKQISKIESGRIQARLSTYLRIANALGVSIDHFLADALLIEPEHLPMTSIGGEGEQLFLRDVIHALLRYLNKKET